MHPRGFPRVENETREMENAAVQPGCAKEGTRNAIVQASDAAMQLKCAALQPTISALQATISVLQSNPVALHSKMFALHPESASAKKHLQK